MKILIHPDTLLSAKRCNLVDAALTRFTRRNVETFMGLMIEERNDIPPDADTAALRARACTIRSGS